MGHEEDKNMERLYDMHCHILPAVDDGSQDMETTRQMLQIAWEDGITDMIATPHFQPGRFHKTVEDWNQVYEEVKEEALKISPDFHIHLGSELFGYGSLNQELEAGKAMTMCGSKYVLIEFLPDTPFTEIKSVLNRVMQYGFWPIVAHVERYENVNKIDKVEELMDMGAFIQVNAASIMGSLGWSVKHFVRKLLKYEMVHFIGSDAHSVHRRKPVLNECLTFIEKKYGAEYARALACGNPEMILQGKIIR